MSFAGGKRHWLAVAVAVSLIGGSMSLPSVAQACTVTTAAPAKPTNFTGTANDEGIRLQWDAAPKADNVYRYQILWGVGSGETLRHLESIELVAAYDTTTGEYIYTSSSPMETSYAAWFLEAGQTYVFALIFGRWDNCGGYQSGVQSDSVTVTFRPDE